jgi:hypothetical protein
VPASEESGLRLDGYIGSQVYLSWHRLRGSSIELSLEYAFEPRANQDLSHLTLSNSSG